MQLGDLGLSTRLRNVLLRGGIRTVGEVAEKSEAELRRITLFGEKSYEELLSGLRQLNSLTDSASEFAIQVSYHISILTTEVMNHPEFEPGARDSVLTRLRAVQNELLSLEINVDEPLAEQIAMVEASLRDIERFAPTWVIDRLRGMFSNPTFSAAIGAVVGASLTRFLT